MSADLLAKIKFLLQPEPWMADAACRGHGNHDFFPGRGHSKKPGLAICAGCTVRGDCNAYGDASGSEYGIWGGVLRTRKEAQPDTEDEEIRMIPKTLSATSAIAYEECPKRFQVEYVEKAPSPGGTAAHLGSACHGAMEDFVKGKFHLYPKHEQAGILKAFYDEHYARLFADSSRYDEGIKLLAKWLARQDWSHRTVLSTEEKKTFELPSSAGKIPFTYIMDRKDLLDNGDIEVVDYKTLSMPVSPEQLKHKLQARCYALAAQLEHPDAKRIWVTFDMLRHDPVGIVFTIEENRATWIYLRKLIERILADDDPQETLGEGCRYCIRRSVCGTLQAHAAAGGPLGITDPAIAADALIRWEAAAMAIKKHIEELQPIVMAYLRDNDLETFETDTNTVKVNISGRRSIDPQRVGMIVGAEILADYGDIGVGRVDEMLKDPRVTLEQKTAVRQLFVKTYGDPKPSISKKEPF